MNEREKRNAIRAYFAPFPKWAMYIAGFGLLCIFTGEGGAIVLGIVLIGAGAAVMFQQNQRISDEEFDRFRDEDLSNATARAVQKWGIEENAQVADAVRVFGPASVNTRTAVAKKGKDGIIRFNPIKFAVLGFGEHQLLAYLGVLDMITGNVILEETEEFFYRDVVAVSTKTDAIEFTHKGLVHQLNDAETFVLTTSGATTIRVPIRSLRMAGILGGGEMPNSQAEAAIASVRAMLRQKKGGVPV